MALRETPENVRQNAASRGVSVPAYKRAQKRRRRDMQWYGIDPADRRALQAEQRDLRKAGELFQELRGAYQAAAAAIAAPALENFVNTEVYDVAEGQARESYKAALPTIRNISKQLMANLRGNIRESRGDSKRATQRARRAETANLEQVAQLQAQALGDLESQFENDLAGSITSDQELLGAAYSQEARENALAEKQHLRDVARAERESHRDRMATGQAVKAAALSQAQTNLNDILNQIGLGRAEAEAQGRQEFAQAQAAYQADQADRALQLAQMGYENELSQLQGRGDIRSRLAELQRESRGGRDAEILGEAQSFAERVTALGEARAEQAGYEPGSAQAYAAREAEFARVLNLMAPVWEEQGLDVGAISEQAQRALQLMRPGSPRES